LNWDQFSDGCIQKIKGSEKTSLVQRVVSFRASWSILWKLLISEESRVDLLDWPVVRQPTSLAFARSSATSGLDVWAVVESILANANVGSEFGQTVVMADWRDRGCSKLWRQVDRDSLAACSTRLTPVYRAAERRFSSYAKGWTVDDKVCYRSCHRSCYRSWMDGGVCGQEQKCRVVPERDPPGRERQRQGLRHGSRRQSTSHSNAVCYLQ
jgi:hypothetical protein